MHGRKEGPKPSSSRTDLPRMCPLIDVPHSGRDRTEIVGLALVGSIELASAKHTPKKYSFQHTWQVVEHAMVILQSC